MNQNASAAQESVLNPQEVLRLKCPSCLGGLNLKRQHLGIAGICVHCNDGIRAVEDTFGEVMVQSLQGSLPAEPEPQPVAWQENDQWDDGPAVIDLPVVESEDIREPQARTAETESPWGFPAPKQEGTQEEFSAFTGTMNAAVDGMPKKEEDPPSENIKPEQRKKSTLPPPDAESPEGVFPFGKTEEDVKFDPASPWANRELVSEEEEEEVSPGFAETLFPKDGDQPQSMDLENGADSVRPHLSSPLVDKPQMSSAAIGLAMEKQKMREKAGPVTRLMRFVIILTLLFGFGYVAVLFAPDSVVDSVKAKVSEWLPSGKSLKDNMPFDLPVGGKENDSPKEG